MMNRTGNETVALNINGWSYLARELVRLADSPDPDAFRGFEQPPIRQQQETFDDNGVAVLYTSSHGDARAARFRAARAQRDGVFRRSGAPLVADAPPRRRVLRSRRAPEQSQFERRDFQFQLERRFARCRRRPRAANRRERSRPTTARRCAKWRAKSASPATPKRRRRAR